MKLNYKYYKSLCELLCIQNLDILAMSINLHGKKLKDNSEKQRNGFVKLLK